MPLQQINVSPLGDYPNPHDYYHHGGGGVAKRCDSAASSMASSGGSSGGDMCRICHCEGESEAPLIAPCYCAGSLRYVHQQCLQQWIKSSNIRSCELCKFQFIMQTKVKPFSEWEHLEMSGFERRKLFCAVMFHAVALTCVVWSLYVLIDRTADEIQNGLLEWPFWTKLVVVAIGFTGGVVFMYIQCKAYLQICQRWKAFNRVIYVQNAPEKPNLTPSRSSDGGGVMVGGGGAELACVAQSSNAAAAAFAHAPQPCFQPIAANSQFKSYRDGIRDREDNEETSIDLKGVRNLHIFFNDEKRIQVQKDKAPDASEEAGSGGGGECCHGNGGGVGGNNGGNGQPMAGVGAGMGGLPGDNHNTGTSWHIKIGKSGGGGEPADDYQDAMKDDEAVRPANGGDLESPVLKLQIKKAEIVIKFGQKSTSSPSNGGGTASNGNAPGISVSATPGISSSSNNEVVVPEKTYDDDSTATHCYGNNESSVNIEIDSLEKDGDDPIVIDLVHQNNRYQYQTSQNNPEAEPLDAVTSQTNSSSSSSSNPVQITLDFGRKDSDNRSLLPLEDVRLLPSGGDLLQTPVDDYPAPKSEPGSGSQSPLLSVRSNK